MITMEHLRNKRLYVPRRASEVLALLAVSTTLFLFVHTSQLQARLQQQQQQQTLQGSGSAGTQSGQQQPQQPQALQGSSGASTVLLAAVVESTPGPRTVSASAVQLPQEFEMETEPSYQWGPLNITGQAGQQIVFFNRVPKVGSQTFMELIRRLSERNGFYFHRDRVQKVETIRLAPDDEERLAAHVSNYEPPAVYVKHVCFTNFTRYGYPDPIYVNLVRDPVERVISWYYYVRAPWYFVERKRAFPDLPLPDPAWLKKDFETCVLRGDRECRYLEGETREGIGDHRRQTLFFCGHEHECTPFNSLEALARAKAAVERHYAVVGVLEDLNTTLTVLENYVPRFFRGASQLYWDGSDGLSKINKNMYKPPVREEIKQLVRQNFTRETEFYHFCRQRLYRQFKALNLQP